MGGLWLLDELWPNVLGGWFGWDSRYLFLQGIDDTIMEEGIPEYVFAMFQGKFAIITPALIAGAFAERVRSGATACSSHSGA